MSSEEKPHKASKRKLEEARKRGELVTSPEINGIAAFGAIVATLAMLGDQLLDGLKRILSVAIKAVEIRSAEEQTALYDSLQEIVWTLAQILIPISLAGALTADARRDFYLPLNTETRKIESGRGPKINFLDEKNCGDGQVINHGRRLDLGSVDID
jgi:flagellar biosynthesis protein FlhB